MNGNVAYAAILDHTVDVLRRNTKRIRWFAVVVSGVCIVLSVIAADNLGDKSIAAIMTLIGIIVSLALYWNKHRTRLDYLCMLQRLVRQTKNRPKAESKTIEHYIIMALEDHHRSVFSTLRLPIPLPGQD